MQLSYCAVRLFHLVREKSEYDLVFLTCFWMVDFCSVIHETRSLWADSQTLYTDLTENSWQFEQFRTL